MRGRDAALSRQVATESRQDFAATLATFSHPRYEIIASGDVYDGKEVVERYYKVTRAAFPDQRNKLIAMHHADDALIGEFDLMGTHKGALGSIAQTGR